MRLNGRSGCGANPESMIATEMPLRDTERASGALPMPLDRRADLSRGGVAVTRTLASSDTRVAPDISPRNEAALPNTTSAGPAPVSTARTAAPRSRSRLNAASRSPVVTNCMMTRADWPDATAALTASSALPSSAVSAANAAVARTLTASATASVRQDFPNNCMQFFQATNRRHVGRPSTSNDLKKQNRGRAGIAYSSPTTLATLQFYVAGISG